MAQVGEEAPASLSGSLTIPWPATLSGVPLDFDVLEARVIPMVWCHDPGGEVNEEEVALGRGIEPIRS